jgi:hypothetical protein
MMAFVRHVRPAEFDDEEESPDNNIARVLAELNFPDRRVLIVTIVRECLQGLNNKEQRLLVIEKLMAGVYALIHERD